MLPARPPHPYFEVKYACIGSTQISFTIAPAAHLLVSSSPPPAAGRPSGLPGGQGHIRVPGVPDRPALQARGLQRAAEVEGALGKVGQSRRVPAPGGAAALRRAPAVCSLSIKIVYAV